MPENEFSSYTNGAKFNGTGKISANSDGSGYLTISTKSGNGVSALNYILNKAGLTTIPVSCEGTAEWGDGIYNRTTYTDPYGDTYMLGNADKNPTYLWGPYNSNPSGSTSSKAKVLTGDVKYHGWITKTDSNHLAVTIRVTADNYNQRGWIHYNGYVVKTTEDNTQGGGVHIYLYKTIPNKDAAYTIDQDTIDLDNHAVLIAHWDQSYSALSSGAEGQIIKAIKSQISDIISKQTNTWSGIRLNTQITTKYTETTQPNILSAGTKVWASGNWWECPQSQIYRSNIALTKSTENNGSGKIHKEWTQCTNFNKSKMPYYDITTTEWTVSDRTTSIKVPSTHSGTTFTSSTLNFNLGSATYKDISVTETNPGRGYKLNSDKKVSARITPNSTTTFNFDNIMIMDPGNFTLQKVINGTSTGVSGAIYQVDYLPLNVNSNGNTFIDNKTATWYFKTDSDGNFNLITSSTTSYNGKSSDARFKLSGNYQLPVGDYMIREVQTPTGFVLSNPFTYQANGTGTKYNVATVLQIRPSGTSTTCKYLNGNNAYATAGSNIKLNETSVNFKMQIEKENILNRSFVNTGDTDISTAEYKIYVDINKMMKYYDVDTSSKAAAAFYNTKIVDSNGNNLNGTKLIRFGSEDQTINGKTGLRVIRVKANDSADSEVLVLKPNKGLIDSGLYFPYLPDDTYIIAESKAAIGFMKDNKNHYVKTSSANTLKSTLKISDPSIEQLHYDGFAFYKKDIITGEHQGNANLNGIKYAVINRSSESIRVHENIIVQGGLRSYTTYLNPTSNGYTPVIEPGQIAAIITTHTKDGIQGYAAMAGLPYGRYEVVELSTDYAKDLYVGMVYNKTDNAKGKYANSTYLWKNYSYTFDLTDGPHYNINAYHPSTNSYAFTDAEAKEIAEKSIAHHTFAYRNADNPTNSPIPDGFAFYKEDKYNVNAQGNANLNGVRFAVINRSSEAIVLTKTNVDLTPNMSGKITYNNGTAIDVGNVVAILETTKNGNNNGYAALYGLPAGLYQVVELRKDATIAVNDKYDGSKKLGSSVYANKYYLWADYNNTFTLDDAKNHSNAADAVSAHTLKLEDTNNPKNTVVVDGFSFYKRDTVYKNNDSTPQGDGAFNTIKFAVVNNSTSDIMILQSDVNKLTDDKSYIKISDKKAIKPGQVAAILTTHSHTENGYYVGGYAAIYGLPYGKYKVYELKSDSNIKIGDVYATAVKNDGTSKMANKSYKYTANTFDMNLTDLDETTHAHATDAATCVKTHRVTVNPTNPIAFGNIKIIKKDAETGKTENQALNSFAGIKYAVVNNSSHSMQYPYNSTSTANTYTVGEIISILTLNKNGTATLNDLPYGTYTVYELRSDSTFKAHDKYVKSDTKAGKSNLANKYYTYCDSSEKVTLNENNNSASFNYTVDPVKKTISIDSTTEYAFGNLPVRGDLNTTKINLDGKYMESIPFLISLVKADENGKPIQKDDGTYTVYEQHIIVTGAEGKLDTSDWHTRAKTVNNVNKLDGKFKDGWFTGTEADLKNGQKQNIWFGSLDGIQNGRGSFLYGTYVIQELKIEATKNYDMITDYIIVNSNAKTYSPVESQVLINIPYFIESIALDNETKTDAMRNTNENASIIDSITFMNLKASNRYAYKNKLYRVDKDGNSYLLTTTNLKEITVTPADGQTIVPKTDVKSKIAFNATAVNKGEKVTVVTELYKIVGKNWEFQFSHNNNLDDFNETVVVPEIKTNAVNNVTRTRIGSVDPMTTPDDYIEYWNLASNHPYVIDISIVDGNGKVIKSNDGRACATSVNFFADAEATKVTEASRYSLDGTHYVATLRGPSAHGTFKLSDAMPEDSFVIPNKYKNAYIVVNVRDTSISGDNNVIASDNTERDVEDETIRWMQISTTASSADYLEGIIPNAKVVNLVDKISYTNLIDDITVRVDGTVVEKESGDTVTTASKEFTLEKNKGTKELTFTFDSTPYAGKDLVVFEKIYMTIDGKDVCIADHSDINDTKQTVSVPDIHTNLVNVHKGTGYKVTSQVVEDITLEDTVKYTNVLPGKKWTLTATLMDKNTNKPVKDANGKNVTGTVTFTPTEKNGEVVVPITFKQVLTSQNWELDESWVCFESMKSGETGHTEFEYAVHNDINDEDQTIYKPKFRTTATAENGSKQILAKPDQKIIDKVELKNFAKAVKSGDKFTLLIEARDAKTGEALLKADGTAYTNTKTFTWNGQTSETIDMVIDATKLEGKVIVFYETLYFGTKVAKGSEVLRENSKDNADQSITVPKIGTTAVDSETRTKTVSLKRIIVDKIDLTYITPDTDYIIYTKLVDKETGEFIKTTDGEDLVVASKYHSPADSDNALACDGCSTHKDRAVYAVNDTINVDIDVSKIADLEGRDLVVYEYLRLVTGHNDETDTDETEEYSEHEDIKDEGQTVEVPKIGTTAASVATGDHVVPVNEEIELVDTVSYSNLIKGETYTVRGKLYNKETNEPITIDGEEITAEKTFEAEAEEGTVDITFKFNSKILEGTTLVAFEDCSWNNIDVATHSDIEDEDQTVDIPKLKTKFFDIVIDKSMEEGIENSGRVMNDITLKDIVNYTNLTPGLEYTVTGTVMDKETGEALLINGEKITASTTFTPEDRTGSVEVVFEHIDASELAGKTTVAFETLNYKDVEITIHADLEDKDQTVKFPEIHTEFIDDVTKDHMVHEGEVTITDIISYKNLVPGKTYTLDGELVFATKNNPAPKVSDEPAVNPNVPDETDNIKDVDTTEVSDTTDVDTTENTNEVETEDVIPVVNTYNKTYETEPEKVMYNGEPVVGSLEFVASETGEGTVEVKFTFDSSVVKNRTIVAFETLKEDGETIVIDNDIENEDETVHVPEVHTTAKDKVDNDNVIDGTKTEQTIVDTVTYKNLVPGKTYKMTGKLVVKKDYKEGEDYEYVTDAEGKIVTSTIEFVAEDYNGTVDVEFTIDASKYAGKKLVAFESVSYNDVEFATHADIEDEEQTVEVSLLLHVKVAKVDADNIKYTLKGAEITIFNADGTIAKDIDGKDCVGITDDNGEVNFTVLYREDNTYYAQETKAPAGYNINNDKFEIVATEERESEGVCLIPIQIKDKIIIIPPQTGDNIPVLPITVSFGGGLACLAVFFMTRKKKSEMVEVENEEKDEK